MPTIERGSVITLKFENVTAGSGQTEASSSGFRKLMKDTSSRCKVSCLLEACFATAFSHMAVLVLQYTCRSGARQLSPKEGREVKAD